MSNHNGSVSVYLFDIDDNLVFLPTRLYLWNAETASERAISSAEFAQIQGELGRPGSWYAWATREQTFRDFRDQPGVAPESQTFVADLLAASHGPQRWQGPSWPLLVHAAENQRPTAFVTARGHEPKTIETGLRMLVERGLLPRVPPILGIYAVTNPGVRARLGGSDPATTVPSLKKLAIKDAVGRVLKAYGEGPPHRFGMSDDDPQNVMLAISAMRDCKLRYPDKRFFVINTHEGEFVKLEVFPVALPVTGSGAAPQILQDADHGTSVGAVGYGTFQGGVASIYVSDLEKAIAYYTSAIGLRLTAHIQGEWAELDAGDGLVIGLHPARPPATPSPGVSGAINIELRATIRLEETMARLKERGVRFAGPIANYPNVRLATFMDPDGNTLVLAEVVHPGDVAQ